MKRILLILSILMITGVSAQKTKVKNLTVNTKSMDGDHITIQWNTQNAELTSISRRKKKKNVPLGEWYGKTIYVNVLGSTLQGTRALSFSKVGFNNRTYDIRAVGNNLKEDKLRVRVIKVNYEYTGGNLILKSEANLKKLVGKTIYIGDKSVKAEVNSVFINKHEIHAVPEGILQVGTGEFYIWFKKNI